MPETAVWTHSTRGRRPSAPQTGPQAESPTNSDEIGPFLIRVCREVPGRHPGWSGSAWPASEIVENRGARIQVCRQWCRRSPSVADGCPGQPSPAHQARASRRLHAQRRSVRPIVTISLPTAIFPARANPHRQLRAPQPRAVNPARARGEARRTPPSRHGRRRGGARSPSRAWPRAPAACCKRC